MQSSSGSTSTQSSSGSIWDELLARVDVRHLMRRVGIPEIVAESTTSVSERVLDVLRRQLLQVTRRGDRGLLVAIAAVAWLFRLLVGEHGGGWSYAGHGARTVAGRQSVRYADIWEAGLRPCPDVPLSLVVVVVALLVLVDREHRALHDVVAGSTVVSYWFDVRSYRRTAAESERASTRRPEGHPRRLVSVPCRALAPLPRRDTQPPAPRRVDW